MFKFVSSIGNSAYQAAAKSGLAAGDEMPPYPCALPLQVITDSQDVYQIEGILDGVFDAIQDLTIGKMKKLNAVIADKSQHQGWKPVDFVDSQGDLTLHSRPHVGPYNFAYATLTLENIPASVILREMHAQSLAGRKRYSSAIKDYKVVHRNPLIPPALIGRDDDLLQEFARKGVRDWHIEYTSFHAPPPVANRDFFILIEKRYVPETDKYYIYGTSVDFPEAEVPKKGNCVRGIVMFGWEFQETSDGLTHAKYISCMNPNGWAPTFLVGWMKNEIAKEIQHSRRLLYNICKGGSKGGSSLSVATQKVLKDEVGDSLVEKTEAKRDEVTKILSSKNKTDISASQKGRQKTSGRMPDGPLFSSAKTGKEKIGRRAFQQDISHRDGQHHHQHRQQLPEQRHRLPPVSHVYSVDEEKLREDNEKKRKEEMTMAVRRHARHHHRHHHHCPRSRERHHRRCYCCPHCMPLLGAECRSKSSFPRVSFLLYEDGGIGNGTCGTSTDKQTVEGLSLRAAHHLYNKSCHSDIEKLAQEKLQVEDIRLYAEEEIIVF